MVVFKNEEEELRSFQRIFRNISEGVCITDHTMKIMLVNPAFCSITGYSEEEIVGNNINMLRSDRHTAEFYQHMDMTLGRLGFWRGELWQQRKNKDIFASRLTIDQVLDRGSRVSNYIANFSDITKTKQDQDEIQYLSNYDPLTELPNRTMFIDYLGRAMATACQKKETFAVLIAGIDSFKNINDSFGHVMGDLLLQGFASRLKRFVNTENHVARLVGDAFAILIQGIENRREFEKFIKELNSALASPFVIDSHEIILSAAMGICFYPKDGHDPQQLLNNADTAMFHAKAKGQGTFVFYSSEMHDKALEKKTIELTLRKAMEKQELEVYYQPKIKLKTGKIIGYEALIRWRHEGEMISPAQFVPIAEETGIIVPIGEWVLRTACQQTKEWHSAGFADLKVSVNLSAYQFRVCDLGELVAGALWDIGLDAKYLDLELTEGLIMDNAERSILMLSVVKRMGVSISIDDFGTGYSSLSYLRKFPINALKIDQSFVRNITKSPEDASIVATVIAMAKSLKLNTIAEGVETQEQLEFLREHDCDEIQGYYYSTPLPAKEFLKLLAKGVGAA